MEKKRERDRQTESERETDRKRDRERKRQRDKERQTQRDRQDDNFITQSITGIVGNGLVLQTALAMLHKSAHK